jgi:hypothetical protein
MKVYGPYKRKDGRMHVIIVDGSIRRTVSYPKYLMECHIGRQLTELETVDHINNDFTDNRIENLQILTREQNSAKFFDDCPDKRAKYITLTCYYCGNKFERTLNRQRQQLSKNKNPGHFCSRSCQGKVYN